MVGIAAVFAHPPLDVVVVGLGSINRQMRAEDRLRVLRSEFLAIVGSSGLHDDGPTLWRTRHIQWAADGVVLPLVVEQVHLVAVEEDAAVAIAHEGIIIPTVPE